MARRGGVLGQSPDETLDRLEAEGRQGQRWMGECWRFEKVSRKARERPTL